MIDLLDHNLFQLFSQQAAATPDAVAIVAEIEVTYAQLARRTDEIACFLSERGLAEEEAVGVVMTRSPDMIASLLAILKAGGAYVPCDPEHPAERTFRMLSIAQCKTVLSDGSTTRMFADFKGQIDVLPVEDIAPLVGDALVNVPAPGGSRLAYILFTSGSTGRPKGVEVEHRSLVNLLLATRDLIGFTSSDRFLATSTVTFDISVAEMFLPLITGGSLVLRDRALLLEPRRLIEQILEHRVSVMQTGPSVWGIVLERANELPRLRVAISTGEAIATELAQRLPTVADQVWNLYGPTETTVWATGHRLVRDSAGEHSLATSSAPIGTAFANTHTLVADDMGLPVADGERGELWVAGAGVARGYRDNPALTKSRFVLGSGGRRYYRTGDVVTRIDGTLHYFGRNDDQVQIHGVRVEPREVEAAVLEEPAVNKVAATWYQSPRGDKSIGAAVVLKPGAALTSAELWQGLNARLPSQMVPTRFVFPKSIPLTSSGKVDRTAIRSELRTNAPESHAASDTDPQSDTERVLIEILQDLLCVDQVRPDDLFIQIGGESLTAFRLRLEIEDAFEVDLQPVEIFDLTAREMAAHIDELQGDKARLRTV